MMDIKTKIAATEPGGPLFFSGSIAVTAPRKSIVCGWFSTSGGSIDGDEYDEGDEYDAGGAENSECPGGGPDP
jgi:hypothetical protein